MKIAELSSMDIMGGGGSIAAYRTHQALLQAGIDATMLVQFKHSNDPTVLGGRVRPSWWRKLKGVTMALDEMPTRLQRTSNDTLHTLGIVPDRISHTLYKLDPDIIQLHWINAGFVPAQAIAKWQTVTPVVWTLHDMWAMCGTEHYTTTERYITGYTNTNRPTNEHGLDIDKWNWQRKQRLWKNIKNLTIVTPSRWLADCAQHSALLKNYRIEVIPNGINLEQFKPQNNRLKLRQQWQLPNDKTIILFGANNVNSPRKGFDLLYQALQHIAQTPLAANIELAVIGNSTSNILSNLNLPVHYFQHINSYHKMIELYNCVDILAVPSREDNLPNMVIEAMACGTPVVSFHIGGLPDMIKHKSTGYLAKPFSSTDLAAGISWVAQSTNHHASIRQAVRKHCEQHFSDTLSAQRYIELYQDIVSESK